MRLLRAILFTAAFNGATTVMTIAGVPVAFAGRRRLARYVTQWGRLHGALSRTLLGIDLRIEGAMPPAPVLVAAKHESAYETLALLLLVDDPVIVLKRQLTRVPVLGRLMVRHGAIPVDRTASAGALRQMLRAADAAKAAGRSVLIFPEGTRVAHGEAPPLQAGFAGLYARLGLPVVPIATDAGALWPRGLVKHPGTIRLRIGEPIPPGLPRREAEARVHAAINVLRPDGGASGIVTRN
ncbi:lysophospholipid acyltransferase family protein [Sphingomonas sp.]|uniref:lysophospholipid acyltransferase family protein n=1 Tax=Sphingomonas sp. TaxID=28214 RepID=UPI003B00A442